MPSNLAFRTDEKYPVFQSGNGNGFTFQVPCFELRTAAGRSINITGNTTRFPKPLEHALRDILALDGIGQNWDSYNAPPVELSAITSTIKFVIESCFPICALPRVAANRSGGVDLHWTEPGKELEISVRPDERFEALLVIGDDENETTEPVGPSQAAEFVRRYRSVQ